MPRAVPLQWSPVAVSRQRKYRPCPSCPRSSPGAEGCAGPNSVGCSPAVKHDTHKQAKACELGRLAERLTANSWQQVAHRAGHVNGRRGSAGAELPQQLFGALPASGWWGADRAGSDHGSAGVVFGAPFWIQPRGAAWRCSGRGKIGHVPALSSSTARR